jgi:hypothetical protein
LRSIHRMIMIKIKAISTPIDGTKRIIARIIAIERRSQNFWYFRTGVDKTLKAIDLPMKNFIKYIFQEFPP